MKQTPFQRLFATVAETLFGTAHLDPFARARPAPGRRGGGYAYREPDDEDHRDDYNRLTKARQREVMDAFRAALRAALWRLLTRGMTATQATQVIAFRAPGNDAGGVVVGPLETQQVLLSIFQSIKDGQPVDRWSWHIARLVGVAVWDELRSKLLYGEIAPDELWEALLDEISLDDYVRDVGVGIARASRVFAAIRAGVLMELNGHVRYLRGLSPRRTSSIADSNAWPAAVHASSQGAFESFLCSLNNGLLDSHYCPDCGDAHEDQDAEFVPEPLEQATDDAVAYLRATDEERARIREAAQARLDAFAKQRAAKNSSADPAMMRALLGANTPTGDQKKLVARASKRLRFGSRLDGVARLISHVGGRQAGPAEARAWLPLMIDMQRAWDSALIATKRADDESSEDALIEERAATERAVLAMLATAEALQNDQHSALIDDPRERIVDLVLAGVLPYFEVGGDWSFGSFAASEEVVPPNEHISEADVAALETQRLSAHARLAFLQWRERTQAWIDNLGAFATDKRAAPSAANPVFALVNGKIVARRLGDE